MIDCSRKIQSLNYDQEAAANANVIVSKLVETQKVVIVLLMFGYYRKSVFAKRNAILNMMLMLR